MAQLVVLYFASLRDVANISSEAIIHEGDLRALYAVLQQRHGFVWAVDQLRVAVDGAFAHWHDVPRDGAEVAFIPPVSGG